MKNAVTLEYEDEKIDFHSIRLLLCLLQKKLTALSDVFFLLLEVMYLTVYENRLLADDFHEISYLIFFENWERFRKNCRLLQL